MFISEVVYNRIQVKNISKTCFNFLSYEKSYKKHKAENRENYILLYFMSYFLIFFY